MAYEQALRCNPMYGDALSNKGLVLASLGKSKEALMASEQALQMERESAYVHYNHALVLEFA